MGEHIRTQSEHDMGSILTINGAIVTDDSCTRPLVIPAQGNIYHPGWALSGSCQAQT